MRPVLDYAEGREIVQMKHYANLLPLLPASVNELRDKTGISAQSVSNKMADCRAAGYDIEFTNGQYVLHGDHTKEELEKAHCAKQVYHFQYKNYDLQKKNVEVLLPGVADRYKCTETEYKTHRKYLVTIRAQAWLNGKKIL